MLERGASNLRAAVYVWFGRSGVRGRRMLAGACCVGSEAAVEAATGRARPVAQQAQSCKWLLQANRAAHARDPRFARRQAHDGPRNYDSVSGRGPDEQADWTEFWWLVR